MVRQRAEVVIGRCFHDPELDRFLAELEKPAGLDSVLAKAGAQLETLRADAPRYYLWLHEISNVLQVGSTPSELNFWAEGVANRPSSASLPEQLIAANVLHARPPGKSRVDDDHTRSGVAALIQAATAQDPVNPAVFRLELVTRMAARTPDRFEWFDKTCVSYPTILPLLLVAMRGHLPEYGGKLEQLHQPSLALAQQDSAGVGMVPFLWFLRQEQLRLAESMSEGFLAKISAFMTSLQTMSTIVNEHYAFLQSASAAAIARTQGGQNGLFAPSIHQHWFHFWHSFAQEKEAAQHVPYLGNRFDGTAEVHASEKTLHRFKKVVKKAAS